MMFVWIWNKNLPYDRVHGVWKRILQQNRNQQQFPKNRPGNSILGRANYNNKQGVGHPLEKDVLRPKAGGLSVGVVAVGNRQYFHQGELVLHTTSKQQQDFTAWDQGVSGRYTAAPMQC